MTDNPKDTPAPNAIAHEKRAMDLTRWANLGMGIAGAIAAWASNSQALLIDGLFSLIGYISAVYAMRISETAHRGPDRARPFGYAADEALYSTFRALALLGLVLFGIAQAILGIIDYLIHGDAEVIRLAPVAVYTVIVAITCFWLAFVHWRAWSRTGRQSDMLRLELTASIYDGVITLSAGVGLLCAPLLIGTALEGLVPVADSIMVLILCSIAILSYLRAFRKGLLQLAGISAGPNDHLAVQRPLRRIAEEDGGNIIDIAMVRMGRKLDIVVYYNPHHPVTAAQIDTLTTKMLTALKDEIDTAAALLLVVSEEGRDF